jgi:MtN3 and saliva related transmembrane protein
MLSALTAGLALWIVYGLMKSDWVIAAANCAGGALSAAVLLCKARDKMSARSAPSETRREGE